MGYPIESVVAEKFHAIQRFAAMPSRWKDYYDIWLISENFEIDDRRLQKAVAKTFEKKGHHHSSGRPKSLTIDFATKYRENWLTFMRKSGLDINGINELLALVEKIWVFLEWPLQGIITLILIAITDDGYQVKESGRSWVVFRPSFAVY